MHHPVPPQGDDKNSTTPEMPHATWLLQDTAAHRKRGMDGVMPILQKGSSFFL